MQESEKKQAHIYVQSATSKAWSALESVHKEAHESMNQAHYALEMIHESHTEDAIEALQQAVALMKSLNTEESVLFSHEVESFEYLEKPETAEKDVAYVRHLLDMGDLQEARRLLDQLRSEIVIIQASVLPQQALSHFEEAQELLSEGKPHAGDPLERLFNDLDIEEQTRPLPLVIAQAALQNAARLPKEEKEKTMTQLNMAREQLEVAHILGYTHKSAEKYDELHEKIRDLYNDTRELSELELLYEMALNKMTELSNSVILG